MRLHNRGLFAALIATAIGLAACTTPEDTPTCAERPEIAICSPRSTASAPPDTATDIVMQGASFRHIIGVANEALGSDIEARFVAAGRKEPCKLHGEDFNIRGDESLMTPCEEGYIAFPEGVKTDPEWMAKPAISIWYEVALDVVQGQPDYAGDILKASCTAAHVVTRKLNYTRDGDGEQLLKFMTSAEYGSDAIVSVRSGLDAAASGQPLTTCKSS